MKGISAAKVLAENGIEDLVILEASDRIGGRIRKENFGGLSVELGAGWIAGVGGKESNPVWELAAKSGLRTCFSDYSNARYNIYDRRSSERFFFLFFLAISACAIYVFLRRSNLVPVFVYYAPWWQGACFYNLRYEYDGAF